MTKRQDTEFYVGIGIGLLTISIAYEFWKSGDESILLEFSGPNLFAAGLVFLVYFAGYVVSRSSLLGQLSSAQKKSGLLVSALAVTALSVWAFFFGMMGCMTLMLVIQLASIMRKQPAMLIAVLVPALLIFVDHLLGKNVGFTEIAVYGTVNVLALLTSYRAISERDAKLKSEQLVRELKATQILLSATTKRDERLRIARNLHDILGHQLTALSLQLEVASHVDDETKSEHIDTARTISTSLLANVRETVSEFREERDLKLREALSTLIEGIPNLDIDLRVEWDESLANERQVETMFRCVQEALTNVVRHSEATRCDIIVSNDDEYLTLVVKDNGGESPNVVPGNGLKGMMERVKSLDGELRFEKHAAGFVLLVTLPMSDI